MTIGDSFNDSVFYYDDWIQKSLPSYEEIFRVAVEIMPYDTAQSLRVLDLGAGTGLFSWKVFTRYKNAHFTLYDLADKMLAVAESRFQNSPGSITCQVGDLRSLTFPQQFDLVISSLAIHHLEDTEKQELFRQVHGLLKPGGAFINVDQIKAPTQNLRQFYWTNWLDGVRRRGGTEERVQDSVQRRTTYDKDALLADQLDWLNRAGFKEVDLLYKNYFVGVFYARK